MKIQIRKERCPHNHPCPSVRVCPVGALKQEGYNVPFIDEKLCTGCKKCVRYCPMGVFQPV